MTNYKELIKNIELDDQYFLESILDIQNIETLEGIEESFSEFEFNLLDIVLDMLLNILVRENNSQEIIAFENLYSDENYIRVFNKNIIKDKEQENIGFNIISNYTSLLFREGTDLSAKEMLLLLFLTLIYYKKSKMDNISFLDLRENITAMLRYKNYIYGNAALNPLPIFINISPLDLICVQLNNKIMRLISSNNRKEEIEDVYSDIIGYLILYFYQLEYIK